MECPIFVHNFRNVVFGSKLAGIFTPRELCKWTGRVDTNFCCLRDPCWFGYTSEGATLCLLEIDFHTSELAMLFIDFNNTNIGH